MKMDPSLKAGIDIPYSTFALNDLASWRDSKIQGGKYTHLVKTLAEAGFAFVLVACMVETTVRAFFAFGALLLCNKSLFNRLVQSIELAYETIANSAISLYFNIFSEKITSHFIFPVQDLIKARQELKLAIVDLENAYKETDQKYVELYETLIASHKTRIKWAKETLASKPVNSQDLLRVINDYEKDIRSLEKKIISYKFNNSNLPVPLGSLL